MTDAPTAKAKKPKAEKAAKTPGSGSKLRGWTAAGDSMVAQTFSYGSGDELGRAAKRAFGAAQKLGKPVEFRLDGSSLTVRVPAANGAVEDDVKKFAKRLAPMDPAQKEAKAAKKASAAGDQGAA